MIFEEGMRLVGRTIDIVFELVIQYWYISIPITMYIFWWVNNHIYRSEVKA